MTRVRPGAVASPNIWRHPEVYEIENRCSDPDGRLLATLGPLCTPPPGGVILDVGCGSGYFLPWLSGLDATARVVGVEPHPGLVGLARRRTTDNARIRVVEGAAQALPLPDASIEIVHARLAYFFGPGCEPGLEEVSRVLRPGGRVVIVDNDTSRSTWAHWFRRGFPHLPGHRTIEGFWSARGFVRTTVDMNWRFDRRADLESVVGIELPRATAEQMLAHHEGLEVDYAVNVWVREN